MKSYTFRLKPGQELFEEIERFVNEKNIGAGCVLSSVGSLTQAMLRLANHDDTTKYQGFFEIVSLTGTVSTNGSHLHLSISDGEGKTMGGHLIPGCKIYTTAEIVLAEFEDIVYRREVLKNYSDYPELVIYPH